jgi:hypothetical protein
MDPSPIPLPIEHNDVVVTKLLSCEIENRIGSAFFEVRLRSHTTLICGVLEDTQT